MTDAQHIYDLHAAFCAATGQRLRIGLGEYSREHGWYEFVKAGFTKDDLLLVIHHLQAGVRKGERRAGCLRWSNLIERLDLFEEEVELARAEQRNRPAKPDARQQALEQLRPTVTESVSSASHVQHVSVAAEKALENLKAWKKETFGPNAAQRESRKET